MTLDELVLDAETRSALEALSRRLQRTPEDIARQAVREVVQDTQALLGALGEATAQATAGETMSIEQWRSAKDRRGT